jgi:heme-binding protein
MNSNPRIANRVSVSTVRRGLYGMFAGGLLTGIATVASAAILAPTANASPAAPDRCSASGMATTSSAVSASMGSYLEAHPTANEALTDIATQSPTQAPESYRAYFTDNPQVATDLKVIQQPVTDLSAQCRTQVTADLLTDALDAV